MAQAPPLPTPPVADAATLVLAGRGLRVADVEALAAGAPVRLAPEALRAVADNHRAMLDLAAAERPVYGVTTGFGALVDHRVPLDQAAAMQLSLLRSHAAGVGPDLPPGLVRAAMAIRLDSLLRARSGVRPALLELLADVLNAGLAPCVPRTGSLGASGDLAPSAHAFLVLVGEGEAVLPDGRRVPGGEALAACGLTAERLAPKEGLALINGTHFMAGAGALAVARARRLAAAADRIGAASLEALRGTVVAFDERVIALRPLRGAQEAARAVRAAVAGSRRVHRTGEGHPQDAYALRCIPQVHGAAREAIRFAAELVDVDLHAVTDNPVVLGDPAEVISAGNFHGQSLALAFDALRLALADLAAVSERRTFRLVAPRLNGDLPAFLTRTSGRSSGLMIAQYTAAALVAELRALAHPVSVDSIPTSDNQEDHVSMGMTAALMLGDALDRLRQVLAIELLCACQALDLGGPPPGPGVAAIHAAVRRAVPTLEEDRPPGPDVERVAALVEEPPVSAGATP